MKQFESFDGNNESERIGDVKLAEGMAYAEKPYRDTSFERKVIDQAHYDFIHSDAYREHLRKIEEARLQTKVSLMNMVDEKIKDRLTREEFWKRGGALLLREVGFDDLTKRHAIVERFRKEEMHFDEEKIQEIKRRYLRRFQTYLTWNEERFNEMVERTIKWLDETKFSEEQMGRNKETAEAPIARGIQAAEDFKRTYLRRAKQGRLSEEEALFEGAQVRERAREEAEARLEYGKIFAAMDEASKHLSWEDMVKYNDTRNWLNKPLDQHIKANDYEEALEYVERLKEIPLFNFASWLQAQIELKRLEIKDRLRARKSKPLRPFHQK